MAGPWTPKNCNDSLTVQTLAMDGGSVVGAAQNATYFGAAALALSSQPFNYWLKLINQETTQYKDPSTGDFATGVYSTLAPELHRQAGRYRKRRAGLSLPQPDLAVCRRLYALAAPGGLSGQPFALVHRLGSLEPDRQHLGSFRPGKRRRGGPGWTPMADPVPWVTQSWQDQNFTFINNTANPIAATTDTYPGGEIYLAGNTYFPETAGVMNAYREYMVWDNVSDSTGNLSNRVPDNWLGLAGQNMEQLIQWDDAAGTEPGRAGQQALHVQL